MNKNNKNNKTNKKVNKKIDILSLVILIIICVSVVLMVVGMCISWVTSVNYHDSVLNPDTRIHYSLFNLLSKISGRNTTDATAMELIGIVRQMAAYTIIALVLAVAEIVFVVLSCRFNGKLFRIVLAVFSVLCVVFSVLAVIMTNSFCNLASASPEDYNNFTDFVAATFGNRGEYSIEAGMYVTMIGGIVAGVAGAFSAVANK